MLQANFQVSSLRSHIPSFPAPCRENGQKKHCDSNKLSKIQYISFLNMLWGVYEIHCRFTCSF